MAKAANPGELRTPICFVRVEKHTNANGVVEERETNIFGGDTTVNCKWVNARGSELFEAMQMELREPATLTLRFSPLYTPELRVYRADSAEPFEVVSIDNVEQRGRWAEIKVQREVAAR